MSNRVAETITGAASGNGSPLGETDVESSAWAELPALTRLMKSTHNRRFRITNFLQLESRTCLFPSRIRGTEGASPSSHSSFCEEGFPRSEPDWHLPEVRFCSAAA